MNSSSLNDNPKPFRPADPSKPDPLRKTTALILAELVCERFGHIYGSRPAKEIENAFVQWIMESPDGISVDTEALKADVTNLCRFKNSAPDAWKKSKPWLNRPKGPKLLKALLQITHDAKRRSTEDTVITTPAAVVTELSPPSAAGGVS